MARCLIFVLLGTLALGCNKSPPAPEPEPPAASIAAAPISATARRPSAFDASAATTATGTAALGSTTARPPIASTASECRAPAAERLVAIGDLHGDLQATRHALQLAGAIDAHDRWVGGRLVVVQTGDVLDRGDDDRAVLALLEKEQAAAKKAGGALYRLNGNHEVMNVQGDFRYVARNGFKAYAGEPRSGRPDVARFPEDQQGRAEAFLPGGREARKLAVLPAVWIVGDTVFAHGGVEPRHVRYGLDRINRELGAWMSGDARLASTLTGDQTPFWTRTYGESPAPESTCALLAEALSALKAARLVVGHTPQKSGITFDCDQKLARIDVGLSAHYGSNPTQVLEISHNQMRVLHE